MRRAPRSICARSRSNPRRAAPRTPPFVRCARCPNPRASPGGLAGLVRALVAGAGFGIEGDRKLRTPIVDEVRKAGSALRRGDLISIVTTKAERATLDRVQAVMAVIEGHAEHVMDAVAPDLVPSLPRLRESLDRRRRSQSGLSRLVARLLGLDLKLRQYQEGKAFCDAVVSKGGVGALQHVFSSPEALPTLIELGDPDAWLERTATPVS